jgi:SpoVK/Ycf46/Vps4 family AAA+-type ATPase
VVGSTSQPDSLRPAFVTPARFERVVEVTPIFPDDVIAALRLHASDAEKRAGRRLFEEVDWKAVTENERQASIGDWVRLLHAVLRRRARCEAAGEAVGGVVTTRDLQLEVDRYRKIRNRLPVVGRGNYL